MDLNNANPYNYAIVNLVGLIPEVTGQYNRTAQNEQIAQNTLAIGAGLSMMGIGFPALESVLEEQFRKKDRAVIDENLARLLNR